MKKIFAVILTAILLISLCACGGRNDSPDADSTAFAENTESTEVPEDAGVLYTAAVSANQSGYCVLTMKDALQIVPDDSFREELTWTSSDESVAKVEEDGLILPQGSGKADISFTDGEASGVALVIVDTAPMPAEVCAVGRLLIETDGNIYESNLSAQQWAPDGLKPHYMETDFDIVYEAEDIYYVKAEYLFNVLCCSQGQKIVVDAPDDKLPQISGDADITNANPQEERTRIDDDRALVTNSVMMKLPDGSTHGGPLYTQIMDDEAEKEMIYYHAVNMDGEIYQDADHYLSAFGVDHSLRYDEEQQALIIRISKKGA